MMTADAVGGVWTYAIDLARGLSHAGVETTLVVLGPSPSAEQHRAASAVAGLRLIDTGLTLDWMANDMDEIEDTAGAVRDLASDVEADVVHLNSPALAGFVGFSAPVLGACHSCVATWWDAVKDGPMPPEFRLRTEALQQGMAACDALVAPSIAFARATASTYRLSRPDVVRNGRVFGERVDEEPRQATVFTSGRLWDEGKNVGVLDEAAGLARIDLRAAGPLEGPAGLNRISLAHAAPLGRLSADAVEHELRRATVYATSALYEPFGLGVLEAAQAGCALVLSDIPTFRELWDGAAIFVDPRDAQGFADAFRHLLNEPEKARQLGTAAHGRAKTYSVQAMTDGVLELYQRLGAAQPAACGRAA
jgi:glycogen synthase